MYNEFGLFVDSITMQYNFHHAQTLLFHRRAS